MTCGRHEAGPNRSGSLGGMAPEPESGDWPKQIADQVEHYVGLVHDKVTVKVVKVVRAVVFGLLAAILGLTALVLVLVILVRVLTYLPGHHVWLAHLILGGLLVLVGIVLMRMRRQPSTEH